MEKSLNFFAGFIVSSGVYYLLCRIWPIPACAEKWTEVGDEITEVSLAYEDGESTSYDEEAGPRTDGKSAGEKASHRQGYTSGY
jgi:nucleobase:cation symporter-1, NCS1 family